MVPILFCLWPFLTCQIYVFTTGSILELTACFDKKTRVVNMIDLNAMNTIEEFLKYLLVSELDKYEALFFESS